MLGKLRYVNLLWEIDMIELWEYLRYYYFFKHFVLEFGVLVWHGWDQFVGF